uniref:DEAD-box ATP-dependent RNA helicase 30-like isoform X2 n=1 Tax=Petromyzon marinus TaxID=7757 RepID=A0AAJ7U6Q4_PETMA|nr:DEAD-box ATP-dependent RNA helicase 30-like isoform X2 [Petromyzon marinus]
MFENISSPVSTSPNSHQNRSITAAQQKPQSNDVAAKLTTTSSSLTSSSTSSSSSPLQQRPKPQNGWVASSSQGQLGKPRTWQPGSGSAIMNATQPPSLLDKPRTLLGLPVFGANAGDAFLPIFKGRFKTSQRPAGRSEPPKRMNFMQHLLSGKDGGSGGGGAGCGGGDGGGEGGKNGGRVEKTKLFVPTFSKVKKQPVSSTISTMPDKPTRQQGGVTSPANAVVTTKPISARRPLPLSFTATTTAPPDETVPTRDAVGPAAWQTLGLLPVGGASGRGPPPQTLNTYKAQSCTGRLLDRRGEEESAGASARYGNQA